MNGRPIRAHWAISLEMREGETLKGILSDALADPEWPLNEAEEELAEGLIEILEMDPNPQGRSPV